MTERMQTLYLIDGYAQFFRAFHAIRTPMSSPVTKEATNATFGFVGMVLKLLRECEPDFVAVALDVSGDRGTFRSRLYPEYKANRDAPPEDLGPQVERCIALLGAMGVPVVGAEGFEADDVIATICRRLGVGDPGIKVRLVSKDKDLQQLLREGAVEMYDVHTEALMTEARLKDEKGIAPRQMVDVLALMGDTVDNVPGVQGIGPKTAAQLIGEYGTIEAVLEEAKKEKGKVKGKRRENLLAAEQTIGLSRELVTLRDDVELEFDVSEAAVKGLDLGALMPVLKELGFNRYQDELKDLIAERGGDPAEAERRRDATASGDGDAGGGLFDRASNDDGGGDGASRGGTAAAALADGRYRRVRTKTDLGALAEALRAAPLVAFDVETDGLFPTECGLVGLSFSVTEGEGWYVPVRGPEGEEVLGLEAVIDALRPVLEDADKAKTGHNLKFDVLVLRNAPARAGLEPVMVRGVAFDTMVADYLVDAARSSHGMDHLARDLLGYECTPITELIGKGKHQKSFDAVPLDPAAAYAAEDADVSLRLHRVLRAQIEEKELGNLLREVELPLVEVLAELEHNGIVVDPAELDRQAGKLRERIAGLRGEIDEAAPRPFNPDSPKQLASVLFDTKDGEEPGLGIKPLKKTKTGYSTDAETLEKLAADPAVESRLPGLVVEYRQLTKLVSTYLEALKDAIRERDGRIHASFNQTVAATGRLSSSDPNLQNIPIRTEVGRQIRKAFKAPEGRVLIGADYSQIELRLLAHLSGDEALIDAFNQGADIHRAVAGQIHGVAEEEVSREQREGAKMVNFGIVYGITAFGLARRLGVDRAEAAEIIDGYKKRFARITEFLESCAEKARTDGYVETMLGRRRPIDGIDSKNSQRRALAERMAINSVVQGSAADLIKLAMVDLHGRIEAARAHGAQTGSAAVLDGVLMLLQIHDELVFEADEGAADDVGAEVKSRMEMVMDLDVPLVVEVASGKSWFEGK